ncbi:hypothetical protein [Bifidobacterium catulorum]|uniref:Uncharacterized protein n=1 Tax=Bifidobacterium catulorum TaxID=1630173 RepID=A0A2U2MRQ5_9BIFI|nr:hypothetical protein [Bifidobacterium catulorum]PWG59509.1 hypothetical protein DF200_07225 [Bifidobacterium catulorum]
MTMYNRGFSNAPTMIIKQSDGEGAETKQADDAATEAFPATEERRSSAEAPTQAIDPERVRAQNADTEAMPPVAETRPIATDSMDSSSSGPIAPTSVIDTTINERLGATKPLDAQLADIAEPEKTEETEPSSDDDLPTRPMIGKPDVNLAGTEHPEGTPNADGAPGPQAAWQQQAAAAQGYASEAHRNGYPGSGETAQATAGPQYANYPGWNQYAGNPNPSAPYTPRVEYKKGPSTATVVWGTLLALFAFGGLASTWLFGFAMSPSVWTILAISALVVIGAALVIGGIASAVRRRKTDR